MWRLTRQLVRPVRQQQRSLTASVDAAAVASRLAVGSHKWSSMDRKAYQDIVHTALANGITTLEVGQEGGDVIMSEILSTIASESPAEEPLPPVQLLQRVGYRTMMHQQQGLLGDKLIEEDTKAGTTIQHNITPAALRHALHDSYLSHAPSPRWKSVERTLLLHNPEVQVADQDASLTQRQEKLRDMLQEAFLYLQEACNEEKFPENHHHHHHHLRGYGVVSNGLSLPSDHPLHLSWTDTVLPALEHVHDTMGGVVQFEMLTLPVNLLETAGLDVAGRVAADRAARAFLADLQIVAMRPLTCYPDQGTGDGKPFILADYQLPAGMDQTLQWTQHMQQPPAAYQLALKTAMAHFDATDLLERKQKQELTTDERETLDGCKLMQSLLHDVDAALEQVRSFAQHEQDVFQKIIPLIHDTFESYDEDTARVLQSFFGAYSLAVRYAIAKNTRHVLVHGDDKEKGPRYPDLDPSVTLQEYALHFLLKSGHIDKLLLGFSEVDQILQDMDIVALFMQEKQKEEKEKAK